MKIFICYFLLLIYSIVIINAQTADTSGYLSLDPENFNLQYLRTDSARLIDVREFFEYKGNRIKNAQNIPSSGNLEIPADTIDKNYALFLYCSSGYRSKRVAAFFYKNGFRKLYNLEGGIVAWKQAGFPVEKGKVRRKR
jgi:rhodanese-related sulfurtransferase